MSNKHETRQVRHSSRKKKPVNYYPKEQGENLPISENKQLMQFWVATSKMKVYIP